MIEKLRIAVGYLKSDRSLGLALTLVTVELVPLQILRVLRIHFAYGIDDASRHPLLAAVAILVFALTVWAVLHILDVLFNDWWHDRASEFWTKVLWLIVLLIWPYGPVAYFLIAYRRSQQPG